MEYYYEFAALLHSGDALSVCLVYVRHSYSGL